jgi:hypothetical protein
MEVSCAVRHIYIYVVSRLRVKCKFKFQNGIFKVVMTIAQQLGLASRIRALGLTNSDPENISVSKIHTGASAKLATFAESRSIERD